MRISKKLAITSFCVLLSFSSFAASNITECVVLRECADNCNSHINIEYEYEDSDINTLLLLRAQEVGLNLTTTVLMPPLSNSSDQIIEQLQEEMLRYAELISTKNIEPYARTILIPINLDNIHWVGLVVRLDENNNVVISQYIDSLVGSIFCGDIPVEIVDALQTVYGHNVHIERLVLLQQTDMTSCGVLTVENLVRVAQGRLDTEIAYRDMIVTFRNHHADLINRFNADAHFNQRQVSGVNKWKVAKVVSLSLQTQHNDWRYFSNTFDRAVFAIPYRNLFVEEEHDIPLFIVFTGPPCSGKTTMIEEFKKKGVQIVSDASREVIEEQVRLGKFNEILNSEEFSNLILNSQIVKESNLQKSNDITILDMALPDSYVFRYLKKQNLSMFDDMCIKNRYKLVFVFYPLPFEEDGARDPRDAVQQKKIYELMKIVYKKFGYKVICVPYTSVKQRTIFINKKIMKYVFNKK